MITEGTMTFLELKFLKISSVASDLYYLMALGPDDVAEYYQQQVEMLEGFNEMDALAERGFVPGLSKVCLIPLCFL